MSTNKLNSKELRHLGMNFLMNFRWVLQGRLSGILGKKWAKGIAVIIIKIMELPLKWILY